MRFEIQSTSSVNSRLGLLTDLGEENDIHTPMAMSYTRGGIFTFVSKDTFKNIANVSRVAQIPMSSVLANHHNIAKFKGGINEFAAIQDFISYVSVHDTAAKLTSGYNTTNSVATWSHNGKINITVETYMNAIVSLKPDWFQALADSDTIPNDYMDEGDSNVTRKRLRKSVERTLSFLDLCIERKNNSPKLSRSQIFGVIEGGRRYQDRIFSAKETSKRNVAGFCIEGFHNYIDQKFSIDQVYNLMCQFICELPDNKPRILHGSYSALDILLAIETGVDIFDSSYTNIATKKGHALLMDYSLASNQPCDYLDLNDKIHRNDNTKLDSNCDCFTCTNHTKAYCCHLLATRELLAGILLMVHNTYQYQLFFSQIRSSLAQSASSSRGNILVSAKDDIIEETNDFQDLKRRVQKRLRLCPPFSPVEM